MTRRNYGSQIRRGLVLESAPTASAPAWASAFGASPWACLNPLAKHVGERRTIRTHVTRDDQAVIGHFRCECGYSYTRSVKRDGSVTAPRLEAYGPTLEHLVAEAQSRKWSMTKTATVAQIDRVVLRRQMEIIGIPFPWNVRQRRKSARDVVRHAHQGSALRLLVAKAEEEGWTLFRTAREAGIHSYTLRNAMVANNMPLRFVTAAAAHRRVVCDRHNLQANTLQPIIEISVREGWSLNRTALETGINWQDARRLVSRYKAELDAVGTSPR